MKVGTRVRDASFNPDSGINRDTEMILKFCDDITKLVGK